MSVKRTTDNNALPHDAELERSVLGGILTEPDRFADATDAGLQGLHFFDGANRCIFDHMVKLRDDGKPIDISLLFASLKSSEGNDVRAYDDLGGATYLASLRGDSVPSNVEHYAQRIVELFHKRQAISIAEQLSAHARDGEPIGDALSAAQDSLSLLQGHTAVVTERREGFLPFPTHRLDKSIRDLCVHGAKAIGCDESAIALPALAVLASAIGNSRRVRLKHSWIEPSIIWAATIGESGTKKSPPWELAMHPLWALENAPRDEQLRLTCSDTTVEALAKLLSQHPRGLLVAREELDGWLGSFGQYKRGSSDRNHWLAMFGGRPMTIDRKTGDDRTIRIEHAAVSVCGTIQPDVLKAAFSEDNRAAGLAARFLFVMPPRLIVGWTDDDLPPSVEARYESVVKRLIELQPEPSGRPKLVGLTPNALDAWRQFVNEHAAELRDRSGDEARAWAKLEGYAARLALIDHCVRKGDEEIQVDQMSVETGIILSRWFSNEVTRVYGMFGENIEDTENRRLVNWIESRGGSVTEREVSRGPREYRKPGEAEKALRALADAGYGTWGKVEIDGGRPTRVFSLFLGGDGDKSIQNPSNSDFCHRRQ